MKKSLLALILLSVFYSNAQDFGAVIGDVYDDDNYPVVDAIVWLTSFEKGSLCHRVRTDLDGQYRLTNISCGEYSVHVVYMGDTVSRFTEVPLIVEQGHIQFLEKFNLKPFHRACTCPPTFQPVTVNLLLDPFGRSLTIEGEDIRQK